MSFFNKTTGNFRLLFKIALFVVAGLIVFTLIPRMMEFSNYFEVGKPWQYQLLTASYDFPIYKSEEELKQEKDSVLKLYTPYFKIDNEIIDNEANNARKNIAANDSVTLLHKRFIINKLTEVYKVGIIESDIYNSLTEQGVVEVVIIDGNRIIGNKQLSELFTIRSAYDYICKTAENSQLDQKILRSANINKFIEVNLKYEAEKSESLKEQLLNQIVPTSGMVQSGERIIDRGQIIDKKTFKVLNSLRIITEKEFESTRNVYLVLTGELLLIFGMLLLFFLYLYLFRPKILNSITHVVFILMMLVATIAMASLTLKHTELTPYIIPFAILPIIIRTFFDSRTALFVHIITILIISFMVSTPSEFLILQIMIGMTAVSSLKEMSQRAQLIQASIFIFITYSLVYIAISLIKEGAIDKINWINFAYFGVNSLLLLFAYGLIYIFEKTFGFLSNVTLIELTNINTPLMMEFSEKAPGTFQHVLQVSNLSAEAAKTIGANPLLARTGALYHDLGKMNNPLMYTENQAGGANPLSDMPYEEAAQIVIQHVKDGVKIAEKKGLPSQVIEFILMHHARSKARYFYTKFKNDNPYSEIDDEIFTYPGPIPNSKETAIVMMADAIEAASRSLAEYNETTISNLVENIVASQIAEGAFNNTPITFADMQKVKQVFKDKLFNIYHRRIVYPESTKQRTKINEEQINDREQTI